MESSLALSANIRLGWKLMEVANTLAYYDTATITAVKSFIVQAPGWQTWLEIWIQCFHSSNKLGG
jgi:hypothetical protein